MRVQGPSRFLVLAEGTVTIDGLIDLSGFAAKDVATLNTGNQVEVGGQGGPGGGAGGDASVIINNSTPFGAFGLDA